MARSTKKRTTVAATAPTSPASDTANTEILAAFRALDNERRLQIFEWLKDPTQHFRPQVDGDLVKDGVCGVLIAEKLGVTQPTLSEHMRVLMASGLVSSKRIKQWTFYQRDDKAIATFRRAIREL